MPLFDIWSRILRLAYSSVGHHLVQIDLPITVSLAASFSKIHGNNRIFLQFSYRRARGLKQRTRPVAASMFASGALMCVNIGLYLADFYLNFLFC